MMKNKGFFLLLVPLGILFLGTGVLVLKHSLDPNLAYLPWIAGLSGFALLLQFFLYRERESVDVWVFPLVFYFSCIGLIMVARLRAELFIPQLRWVIIGILLFFLVMKNDKKLIQLLNYPYLTGLCCLIWLCSPFFFGTEIGGSRNWIIFGPLQMQPSEFGKIFIVFFLASYLSEHKNVLTLPSRQFLFLHLPPLRFIAPLLCIWGIAILMFVLQRDLGSALLFFGIAVFMTYMATGSKSYVFLALSFFAVGAGISYFLFGHVRVRFDIWLHPWADPNGQAYQIVQSLFAFGTGGIWGTGFAHGHPLFIPEVHTDFIFSAIAEEFGFIGAIVIILGYCLFFYRGIRIALANRLEPCVLLAAGCSTLFFLQAFIIIAGVTKFLPMTGITLPFVSYGGSSMVSSYILAGVLAALSKKENGSE